MAGINVTTTGSINNSVTNTTTSFTAPDLIDDSGSGFTFSAGDQIRVSGSAGNSADYTVIAASASQLQIAQGGADYGELATEAAGPSITIAEATGLDLVSGVNYFGEPVALVHPQTVELRDGGNFSPWDISNDDMLAAALDAGEVTVDLDGVKTITTSVELKQIGSGLPSSDTDVDQVKTYYVGKHGDDANNGLHPDKAKLTINSAITDINAAPPSDTNKAKIVVLDAYSYSEVLDLPENTDLDMRNAQLQSFGDVDVALKVTNNSDVYIGRMNLQDDGNFGGVDMIGGSGDRCRVHVEKVQCLPPDPVFNNTGAGFLDASVGYVKMIGNQGTVFYMQSGALGGMRATWGELDLGGNATGVNAAEGLDFFMAGGNIKGANGSVGINIGDIRASGYVGRIDCDSGTAYEIAPAAVLGLQIAEIVNGTRTQTTNNGGLIITAEADRQVYSENFKLGAYPGFGSMLLDAAPVTGDHTATFQNASGTLAYLSDVQAADEWSEVLANGNTSGANNAQMSGTTQMQFGGTVNYIANGAGGLLEYDSNKGHEFHMTDSTFNLKNKGQMTLIDTASSNEFNISPETGAIGHNGTFVGSLDFDSALTASHNWTLPDATGTIALTSDIPAAGLATKAGVETSGFTGTPLTKAVTFGTAFADANYSVSIVGADARSWTVESQTAAGFTINTNSSTALTGNVSWTAIKHGETS